MPPVEIIDREHAEERALTIGDKGGHVSWQSGLARRLSRDEADARFIRYIFVNGTRAPNRCEKQI